MLNEQREVKYRLWGLNPPSVTLEEDCGETAFVFKPVCVCDVKGGHSESLLQNTCCVIDRL